MKKFHVQSIVAILMAIAILTSLCACNKASEEIQPTELSPHTVNTTTLTIKADGRQFIFEDAEGQTIQALLEQCGITLQTGDYLTATSDSAIGNDLILQVARRCSVRISVATEDPENPASYPAVLTGGTVADALAAVGVELTENHITNYPLDAPLEDGMEILITLQEEEEEIAEETEPEETEPSTPSNTPSSTPSTPAPTEPAPTAPAPTEPAPTEPAPTEPAPTEPAPTEPTQPERTVVSVEVYEDCDGSGHGVKVITYSDGTQEEVYF